METVVGQVADCTSVRTSLVNVAGRADQPSLIYLPNPYRADVKEVSYEPWRGETVGDYLRRHGMRRPSSVLKVWHNEHPVPLALWSRLIPRAGDMVVIREWMAGGGGSGKILRSVAMIALLVASITIPGAGIAGLYSGFGLTGSALALTSAGIMIGGSLLINALLPVPSSTAGALGNSAKYQSSPTYSISGSGNKARAWQPMLLVFGKMRVVPDLAAQQFTYYDVDTQYLSAIFHFGLQGTDLIISDIRIGDTDISNYSGISVYYPGADGRVANDGAVTTIQGFNLNNSDGWISRTTPPDTVQIRIELVSQLYYANDDGTLASRYVDVQVQYRLLGAVDWTMVTGGGDWFPDANAYRHTRATQTPTHATVACSVPAGQYEVRCIKLTPDVSSTRESNSTAVNEILAYQADYTNYTGQARMGIVVQATGQLNGSLNSISAMVGAQCPVWNGSSWVMAETSNPAWWYRWFAIGKRASDGGRLYGCCLDLTQIDDDAIKAWGAFCDAKRLTFNWVLDSRRTQFEVLQKIALCGRASPTYQTGKLGVIWDAEGLPVTAMFGPFNIKAGTFQVAYINDGSVDEVVYSFSDAANNYQMGQARATVPGTTVINNSLDLDLDGCTDADMAGRAANLMAAQQVWRRRSVTWETDIEGFVATRGDVVSMSHDLTVWGYSGRLMPGSRNSVAGDHPVMILDGAVPSSGSGVVMLRSPSGDLLTVNVVSDAGSVTQLRIVTGLGGFPMPGDPGYENVVAMDWAWQFDPLATPGRRFKITDVAPNQNGVRFTAVDDDNGYYECETNPYAYAPPGDGKLLTGAVLSLSATEQIASVVADQIRLTVAWVLSADMPALVTITVNSQVRFSQIVQGRSQEIIVATGDAVTVTVMPKRATGSTGTPRTINYLVAGLATPLPALTGLNSVFRDGLTTLTWQAVVDPRNPAYEIRLGQTWDNSRTIATTTQLEQLTVGNGQYWVAARFRLASGLVVYGAAEGILIAGATLVRNVLIERDEAPTWPGTISGGAFVYGNSLTLAPQGDFLSIADVFAERDVLWYGGPAASGVYSLAASARVDVGYVAAVRIGLATSVEANNINADILAVPDIFALADVLSGSDLQHITVTPQLRYAQVDGAWSDWQNYVPGLINARYFDARLLLSTDDPTIIPFVTEFTMTVDVPDLMQHAEGVAVPAVGMTVVYSQSFHAIPNVQITILDAQAGDRVLLSGSTVTGFFVQVLNSATPVVRSINWLSQGY